MIKICRHPLVLDVFSVLIARGITFKGPGYSVIIIYILKTHSYTITGSVHLKVDMPSHAITHITNGCQCVALVDMFPPRRLDPRQQVEEREPVLERPGARDQDLGLHEGLGLGQPPARDTLVHLGEEHDVERPRMAGPGISNT